MSDTRKVYMHLLDGKPAEFDAERKYIYFAGRQVSRFATSLRQIRTEQRKAILAARKETVLNQEEWANPKRYSYILVRLPE
jgi:hypothetical protein